MSFDFYQLYKGYSNVELLKIVNRPGDYQPDAVAIAAQILNERQVTAEEVQYVGDYFQQMDNSTKEKEQRRENVRNKAADFIEPVLQPNKKIEPVKWVNVLLLFMVIQYVWSIYSIIRRLARFLSCKNCSWDISYVVEIFIFGYVPVMFFLIFKRRRWGWILLFADNLVALILSLSQVHIFFKYQFIHKGDPVAYFFPMLIKAAFLFFLWREPIAAHFGITQQTKKNTALYTAAGSMLFVLIMFLLFGT